VVKASSNSKIKICHIITRLELGGAQQVTLDTLRYLDKDIFEKFLITNPDDFLVNDAKSMEGLKIYFIPELIREIKPYKDIVAFYKIYRVLRKIKPDIVHTHSSKAGILGRIAARKAGVPVVLHTYHGFSFHDFQNAVTKSLYIWIERIAAKFGTHFYAVSKANIEKGVKNKIFMAESCMLTRDAIHTSVFKTADSDSSKAREDLGIPNEAKIVGMIACFKPQKSPEDFIYIAKLVLKGRDDIRFILVGDGILRNKLERLIKALDLEGYVILTGWREDIPNLIKSFDCFVLTSLHEGLPMVIPQAISAKVPVIASSVDGTCDIIEDGVNGFLVEPKDIDGFYRKILKVLSDHDFAKMLSEKAYSKIDEFDIHEMVKRQSDFYKRVAKLFNKK
jgi:glycosyltransferase involved in cell wall biosynthesis